MWPLMGGSAGAAASRSERPSEAEPVRAISWPRDGGQRRASSRARSQRRRLAGLAPGGSPSNRSLLINDGIGLDLDEHHRVDQAADFHHCGGRANRAKELAVRLANLFPVVDVAHINARAHDIVEAGARAFEDGFDVAQGLYGLGVGVARADDLAVGIGGGCARD